MRVWLSVHIHFAGTLYGFDGDRVVVDVARPAIIHLRRQRQISRCFFVRYFDPTPHIRVRVATASAVAARLVRRKLDRALRTRGRSHGVSLAWRTYEPETQRYGGARALAISERFFGASSRFAVAEIENWRQPETRSARLTSGLLGAIVLIGMLTEFDRNETVRVLYEAGLSARRAWPAAQSRRPLDEVASRARHEARAVERVVGESWRRLVLGESLTPDLNCYRRGIARAQRSLIRTAGTGPEARERATQLLRHVRGSYLHMTNNRLGIHPVEETYIAEIGAIALEAVR